jgi:hypothetical protein
MARGEFFNQGGDSGELIPWEGIRYDEHSAMGALVVEESNREPDEIVPVSGHQTSFLCRCKVQLALVRCLAHPCLMSTERIDSASSEYLCNLGAEVFIQVKLHDGDLIKG